MPPRLEQLTRVPFAHRGLHGPTVVENSPDAFRAAIAAGHGIELDVQAAADGTAFVFHDAQLDRLTDATGPLVALAPDRLRTVRLRGSGEPLATLAQVLTLVAGRVPVLVEIKASDTRRDALCRSVGRALEGYAGPVAVMSFDPRIVGWFVRGAPAVVRGLVVSEQGARGWRGRLERTLSLGVARPDFLAHDIRDLPSPFAARLRASGRPVLTWTVRSPADRAVAAEYADQIIYETGG